MQEHVTGDDDNDERTRRQLLSRQKQQYNMECSEIAIKQL